MKNYLVKVKDEADRKRLAEEYAYLDYIVLPFATGVVKVVKRRAKKKDKDKSEKPARNKRLDKRSSDKTY